MRTIKEIKSEISSLNEKLDNVFVTDSGVAYLIIASEMSGKLARAKDELIEAQEAEIERLLSLKGDKKSE